MALPSVNIIVTNGNLGQTAGTNDSVSGMILSGVAVSGKFALGDAKQIFSLDEAVALGIDAAYDTANSVKAYQHIKDFYTFAPIGTELWIMVVSNTNLLATLADKTQAFAKKLLDAAQGTIKLLGITRTAPGAYAPTVTEGIDPDVLNAIPKAQELADEFAAQYQPVRVILEGRGLTSLTTLRNLKSGGTANRVAVVVGGLEATAKWAAVGLVLGKAAGNPVQRNIGRVKDGDLGITNAYLSDGNAMSTLSLGQVGSLHDKGYIFFRKYTNRNGFYINDDPTATSATDDYNTLANGRVIDKAIVLAYNTYVDELLDDIEIDAEGRIEAAVVKLYQANIEKVIYQQMQAKGEISGVAAYVDPNQDVLATQKIQIKLAIRPKGYSKTIEVLLGFDNPAN